MSESDKHAYNRQHHPLLELINESTKWSVSAAAFGTLVIKRDLISCWCIIGSVLAAVVCRALKFAINEARPPDAARKEKKDPGMPSSHANSLAFLSTFVSLGISNHLQQSQASHHLIKEYALPCFAIFLSWLRIALGYHTLPQVVVGYILGSSTAALWWQLGRVVLYDKSVLANPSIIYALAIAASVLFSVQNVSRWFKEKKH